MSELLQSIENQESFTVPYDIYRNELLNILDFEYNDYIVVVNDEVADVGIIIKPGDEINIFPMIRRKYLSTGAEKILMTKFYEVIGRYTGIGVRDSTVVERVIGTVLEKKAKENGYSGFSRRAFERVFRRGKDNKFTLDFLERYEFLFNQDQDN